MSNLTFFSSIIEIRKITSHLDFLVFPIWFGVFYPSYLVIDFFNDKMGLYGEIPIKISIIELFVFLVLSIGIMYAIYRITSAIIYGAVNFFTKTQPLAPEKKYLIRKYVRMFFVIYYILSFFLGVVFMLHSTLGIDALPDGPTIPPCVLDAEFNTLGCQ